jgi:chromosome segregation ATPase
MSSAGNGNPMTIIQQRLQVLRAEREQTESELESLEKEKKSIRLILPKVISELDITRDSLKQKAQEMAILDNAIEEIEQKYGHILFTANFFTDQNR